VTDADGQKQPKQYEQITKKKLFKKTIIFWGWGQLYKVKKAPI